MAIAHTRVVQKVECRPDGFVTVVYINKFDDPDDDLLPVETTNVIHIMPKSDVSAHDQFVQDVCSGAWANVEYVAPEVQGV